MESRIPEPEIARGRFPGGLETAHENRPAPLPKLGGPWGGLGAPVQTAQNTAQGAGFHRFWSFVFSIPFLPHSIDYIIPLYRCMMTYDNYEFLA